MSDPTPLAISMGEPAGVGPDLILHIFSRRVELNIPPFLLFGNLRFLTSRARHLGLDITFASTDAAGATSAFATALPVSEIDGLVPDKPGDSSPLSAHVVIEAISHGVSETLRGACRGLVTAPVHKGALYTAGFRFPGHTEFLAEQCRPNPPRHPVMMLTHEELRVVPLTIHVPISAVPGLVTEKLIVNTVRTLAHDLRTRFGIETPRIAVTGLNPHAGEGGSMGREEIEIIAPAIAALTREGFDLVGPLPADTVFFEQRWREYDAVVAMYHDQALIPIKALAFDSAVNVTLGLPIVRTSPDHGTAFDLAGTGKASAASFVAAIRLCDRLTTH